jgi:hypothetical protein
LFLVITQTTNDLLSDLHSHVRYISSIDQIGKTRADAAHCPGFEVNVFTSDGEDTDIGIYSRMFEIDGR